MKVVLAGGGTGGHIYPAVSVGQALQETMPGVDLLFVGSSHGPEGGIAEEAGILFKAVPSSPLTKSLSLRNMASFGKLFMGFFRARRILKEFRPDVVIGTGGYTTAAVLLAQKSLGGRLIIHEQNAVPGRTNLWLSRIVDKVCVTVDTSAAFFPEGKVEVTGMPVRREFAELPDKKAARQKLGLDGGKFTVLVVGGSQGAKKINELMVGAWPLLDDGNTQVLHQAGKRNIDEMNAAVKLGYRVEAYLDMPEALAAADLVIGRSGASTIAEIAAAGLPSVLIPYPFAYADHQRLNAEYVAEKGAAVVVDEKSASSEALAGIVKSIRDSSEKMASMAAACKAMGGSDAARRVADVAIALASKTGR